MHVPTDVYVVQINTYQMENEAIFVTYNQILLSLTSTFSTVEIVSHVKMRRA